MNPLKWVFTCFLIAMAGIAVAQDRIVLRKGTEIAAKVTEVGTTEISYRQSAAADGPIFKCKKTDVDKILFANGEVWVNEEKTGGVKGLKEDFDNRRKHNKGLVLVGDSMVHHILTFHLGAPELDIYATTALRFQAAFSYEYQPKGNRWGMRVMPVYTLEIGAGTPMPQNVGSISLALSPRYYLKNWRSSQYYLGIEGMAGMHIPDPKHSSYLEDYTYIHKDLDWTSVTTTWSVVTGGHVVFPNDFNLNIELGAGVKYQYFQISDDVPDLYLPKNRLRSSGDLYFSCFARFGLGGRIRKKA